MVMIDEKHTKYRDLPQCMRCQHCKMDGNIPCRTVGGHYGFFYTLKCTNIDVTWNTSEYGDVADNYWYDPNTQRVWVDGAGEVEKNCGCFSPLYNDEPCDSVPDCRDCNWMMCDECELLIKCDNKEHFEKRK